MKEEVSSPIPPNPESCAASSTYDDDFEIDPKEQARILRKVDLHLLPIITLLYLMSFLDRSSIGNAKIAGLAVSLDLLPVQYNIALSIFFISYVSFEIPSNILLKKLSPSLWLPSICLGWGIVMTMHGIVQNFGGLVACRLLLGFLEAGLFPGVVFLLTIWYPRHALVFRFCVFFSAATLAGAFGGLLARGLVELDGVGGLEGWRWIFIIEGIATVVVAVLAYMRIQDSPSTAQFLSPPDKKALKALLARDSASEAQDFSWSEVRGAFTEWKVWTSAIICLGIALPTFSFALFLPSIIRGLGFTAARSQLMTVPPYVAAFVFTISVGWVSDRYKSRGIPLLIFTGVGIIGYAVQVAIPHSHLGAKYFATFLSAVGIFTASGLNIPWLSNNLRGHSRRATGSAVQVAVGQLGGIAGAYIYREQNAPRYLLGHGLALGFLAMAFVTTALQWWLLKRENEELERKEAAEGVVSGAERFRNTL
ncbi:MFS general substrate transporter [Choiromyces venosus 120613-1]|uniref:MFS general substrate transporter n=1 Tax=Choiromyces venosus 120613-1 TaxID=1336337 RepID=A0A3N4J9P3_9PEZI|nr:MFS general substrate transporter [Choiromyces venosus 120613-1]